MRNLTGFLKYGIPCVSIFALAASVVWLTSCGQNGSAIENSGRTLVGNLPRALEPVDPWTADRLLKPEQLAKIISDPGASKPLILYFGPAVLFRKEHVPGAKLIGPLSAPEDVKNLQKEVKNLGANTDIVIYCGCCPWDACPNIRPAFQMLRDMGFKQVRVLFLPDNFRQGWVNKGFPVQKEQRHQH